MTETWFEIVKTTADGKFYVLRMDRETLPKATVVSGPFLTKQSAEDTAKEMRKVGTA
jgi:hypothetical protein